MTGAPTGNANAHAVKLATSGATLRAVVNATGMAPDQVYDALVDALRDRAGSRAIRVSRPDVRDTEDPGRATRMRITRAGFAEVLRAAAERHHLSLADVCGRVRTKSRVAARRDVIRAMYDAGKSAPEIGAIMGRDHTSILSALRGT